LTTLTTFNWNIAIEKGELSRVMVGEPPEIKEAQVIDAKAGVVLGKLSVGSPASFMILNADPRENINVLLDTKKHTIFAIKKGQVILDKLKPAPKPSPKPQKEKEKTTWFAYNVPPVSLPSSYENTRKWNRFKTKYINGAFIGALALDRAKWFEQDNTSKTQSGDLESFNGGEIRALRFGLAGTINFPEPWIFMIAGATNAFDKGFDQDTTDKVSVYDARLDIPLWKDTNLAIGKQKEPISMERLTSMLHLPMQERSAVADAMLPIRNTGLVLSGTALKRETTWAVGVFNSWNEQDVTIGDGATQFIGRGTWTPLHNKDESSLIHLGLGLRYSNAKMDGTYKSEPEVNQAPDFVNSGAIEADYSMLYDIELAWRWGPMLLNGEYIINQVDSESAGDPTFSGWHVTLSYALTGEMRPYNRRSGLFSPLPVADSVNTGGWGALELAGRYSTIDLNEGGVLGGEMDVYSLGFNWWLTRSTSFGMNYRHVVLDDENGTGHSDVIMTRLTLMLD